MSQTLAVLSAEQSSAMEDPAWHSQSQGSVFRNEYPTARCTFAATCAHGRHGKKDNNLLGKQCATERAHHEGVKAPTLEDAQQEIQ